LEIPLALPVIVSDVLLSADVVMMSNGCDCSPADTTMLVATGEAIAGLLLLKTTVTGPGPALHSSFAVPVDEWPLATLVGNKVSELRPIRRTVRF